MKNTNTLELLYYDGHCGLCHNVVRFVIARDPQGSLFRFAPLDSDSFRRNVPAAIRATLPDSVVIWTRDGRALVQSAAVLHILKMLGGLWRVLGLLGSCIPSRLLNLAYSTVARVRHRLFPPPPDACPMLPKQLRERFDV